MTDEEKKVIEYWEEKLKEYKKEIEQRQNDEFKGYGTAEDIAKLKYCNLHTLLNLIQTQQEEIERYKIELAEVFANTVNSDLKQKHKHEEDLEALHLGWKAEIKKKDNIVRSIISRLDNDIKNIAETKAKKKSEYHLDDYTRNRLKAYKTKTREIKEYIEKEYFAVEKENKDDN